MKLPPLKLNKRPVVGRSTSIIHRGATSIPAESTAEEPCPTEVEEPSQPTETAVMVEEPEFVGCNLEDEPTHHELQSKANVKGWEKLRGQVQYDHFITSSDVLVQKINVLPSHSCESTRTILLKCLDELGTYVTFTLCTAKLSL